MRIDAIRSMAIRYQPGISDAPDRFANNEPSSSAHIDATSDFCAAMAGFAATVAAAPGNVPDPCPVGLFSVAWDQNRGLWYVLDSDGNVRSRSECQEVVERHALEATGRLNNGVADCPVCGQPVPPGSAAVAKPAPRGRVRCTPTDAGARHDNCVGKPTPQIQNQQQGSSASHMHRAQVLAWIRKHGLAGADLQGVDLTRADLGSARLPYAKFNDADLTGADFAGAIFDDAELQYAELGRAELNDGTLTEAEMARILAALDHAADADIGPPPAGETQ